MAWLPSAGAGGATRSGNAPSPPPGATLTGHLLYRHSQDEFQRKFWLLRQAEWQPYTLLHSPLRITQGERLAQRLASAPRMYVEFACSCYQALASQCSTHVHVVLACASPCQMPPSLLTSALQATCQTRCISTSLHSARRPQRALRCGRADRWVPVSLLPAPDMWPHAL